jgi:hypothetical protein
VDIILIRLLFVVVVAVTCFVIQPFGRPAQIDAGIGALIGAGIAGFVLGGGIGRAPGFAESVTTELDRITPVMPAIRVSALGTDAVTDGCLASGTGLAWGKVMTALPTAPSGDGARSALPELPGLGLPGEQLEDVTAPRGLPGPRSGGRRRR